MFKLFQRIKNNKKGFTLTELIVVVAILGVLAVVATPIIGAQLTKAKTSTDAANATTILNILKRADAAGASANGNVTGFALFSSSTADIVAVLKDDLTIIPAVSTTSTDNWIITRTYDTTKSTLTGIKVTHGATVTASTTTVLNGTTATSVVSIAAG